MKEATQTAAIADVASLTPMMRQYYELKQQSQEAILFFRMGDFYEVFGTDAELVAPILEIVLTSREKGDQTRIPFCGVPHHAARHYWLKLVKLGYKVAIADQVEDPKQAKGIVRREITRIWTPGCTDEMEALEKDAPNYLAAALEHDPDKTWTLCLCDVSTGELRLGTVASYDDFLSVISTYRPRELLLRRFLHIEFKERTAQGFADQVLVTPLPEAVLRDEKKQNSVLKDILGVTSLATLGCGAVEKGPALLSAVFNYLQGLKQTTSHFRHVQPLREAQCMNLDEIAARDLELFETLRRRQSDGSLFKELNTTMTPMGARRLRRFLAQPLICAKTIAQRQKCVTSFYEQADLLNHLRKSLSNTYDLDRLITRVVGKTIYPHELLQLRATLTQAAEAFAWLNTHIKSKSPLLNELLTALSKPNQTLPLLQKALTDQPTGFGQGDGVFKAGFSKALDDLCHLNRNSNETISQYENKLKTETGISSLKIKQHKTFGLLIEVTKANLAKVPSSFIRRQTMVNNERFSTPELGALSEALSSALDQIALKEQELYAQLLSDIATERETLQAISEALSQIDVFHAFAWKATQDRYVCPVTTTSSRLHLVKSRHPVVERFVGKHKFVANDVLIDADRKHLLITGPNMGGKSTVMRQVALSAIMHQIGSYIPAESAELPIFDSVYTRVGASDDLAKGQSTFLVEMVETAHILRQATKSSLVILDEVGRGTSTQDGLAIAAAILEELVNNTRCMSLFATHYHELIGLAEQLTGVALRQTEIIGDGQTFHFTHRLIEGSSARSYGIEVAKLAGLPQEVILRAQNFLAADQLKQAQSGSTLIRPAELRSSSIPHDFSENRLQEISERLRGLRIHRTTPLQALNILNDLKLMLDSKEQTRLFD